MSMGIFEKKGIKTSSNTSCISNNSDKTHFIHIYKICKGHKGRSGPKVLFSNEETEVERSKWIFFLGLLIKKFTVA